MRLGGMKRPRRSIEVLALREEILGDKHPDTVGACLHWRRHTMRAGGMKRPRR